MPNDFVKAELRVRFDECHEDGVIVKASIHYEDGFIYTTPTRHLKSGDNLAITDIYFPVREILEG